MARKINKVLMFKQSSIGDCLMAGYFLENIRAQYPHARVGIVVGSRGAMIRDLFTAYPWIEVLEANRRSFGSLWRLWRAFGGSDLVVTEYTGGKIGLGTKLMARLLAYKGRLIGFDDTSKLTKYFYNTLIPLGGRKVAPRLLERQALAAAHIPVTKEHITYRYLPKSGLLERFGVKKNGYVVVHLFSGAMSRGLSPERQVDLLKELSQSIPTMPFLLTGTEKERAQLERLNLPVQAKLVATTLQEAAELMDHAAVMVSVGTGTSHMAAAMRVPLVVFTNCQGVQWAGREQWGTAPIEAFCNPAACPAGHSFEGYAKCMDSVDMHKAALAAKNLLRE